MLNKIIKIFDDMWCPAIVILKTSRAGEVVDNGHGVERELPLYAVIHYGSLYKNDKFIKYYEWEHENNISIMKFSEANCNVDSLVQELYEMDGYEVVWKNIA